MLRVASQLRLLKSHRRLAGRVGAVGRLSESFERPCRSARAALLPLHAVMSESLVRFGF
jgi:hypothetical protein